MHKVSDQHGVHLQGLIEDLSRLPDKLSELSPQLECTCILMLGPDRSQADEYHTPVLTPH